MLILVRLVPLFLLGLVVYLVYRRSREIFFIKVSKGSLTVVRGFPPAVLVQEFSQILGGVSSGEIGAHRAVGGARLIVSGAISDSAEQRLRNVFHRFPLSELSAPRVDKKRAIESLFLVGPLLRLLRRFFR